MVELGNDHEPVALFPHRPGRRLLVAASDGRGFFVARRTRPWPRLAAGRQVLNPAAGAEAAVCVEAAGDTVAVVGSNRRLLLFPAADVPTMARGRGVILQRYRDAAALGRAGLRRHRRACAGARAPACAPRPRWSQWHGKRGQAGRAAPRGFPAANCFL